MATYVIGDVQGCFASLQQLGTRIGFDAEADRLWFVGDLVNRGPRSLEVMRWVRSLGDRAVTVLGNHDLHLLARLEGVRGEGRRDTLDEVLDAPDRDELCDWLAHRPLLFQQSGFVMVHAGLLPQWCLVEAAELASEVERGLRSSSRGNLLGALYGSEPGTRWESSLSGTARYKAIVGAFTRLRTCTKIGELCADYAGAPGGAPSGCRPWYEWEHDRVETVLFGHWAALGLYQGHGVVGLDTGCVWGRSLTAYRLEDGKIFQQPNIDA